MSGFGSGGGGFTFGAPATTTSTVTFGSPATFGTAATQQTYLPNLGLNTTSSFGSLQQPAQTGGSLFNLNTTANQQNVTQQPASNTGFSFGGVSQPAAAAAKTTAPVFGSTATPATSTTATGFGGNLFSTATPASTTTATQSLTQTPQVNTFGSLTTTSTAAPTSTPAFSLNLTQPTQTNSLLNNTATQNLTSTAPTNQSSLTAAAAKPASTGFNLNFGSTTTTQTTTTSTNQATSTTSNASLSIPQSTNTTQTSTTTQQQSTQQPQQPPQMTFKQLEGYINVWLNELNQMEKDFQTQSQTINSWDSLLVNNGIKISNVNENLDVLKEEHKRIDQQLDFVISQQNELEQLLEPLEKTQVDFNINDTASTEREFTYSLVDTVSSDLLGIGTELQNFIKKLNETKANQDANDPLSSIGKILNSHLDALQYIEHQINVLKKNIDS